MELTEQRKLYRDRVAWHELRRDNLIDIVGVWGPLLAPAVPAFLTMVSISMYYPTLLGLNRLSAIGIGLVSALVIEVLGVVSVETFMSMTEYNKTIEHESEKAPTGWSGSIMALYFSIVISLVVLLKLVPSLAILSLIPLTLLAGVTSWIVVMRKQHRDREFNRQMEISKEIEKERLEISLETSEAEISELREIVGNLEISGGKKDAEISELQEISGNFQIAGQKKDVEISTLQSEISILQSENRAFQAEIAEISRKNGSLQSEISTADPEISKENGNSQSEISTDDLEISASSKKLSKEKRREILLELLLEEYAGAEISDIDKAEISRKLQVTARTIGNDISEIWADQKWNGRVGNPDPA